MFYTLLQIQGFFEGLYQTVISLLRILLRLKFRNVLSGGNHSGRELTILGNGPSLKTALEGGNELILHRDLMAVNQFVLSDAYSELKPGNYVLLDIGFFREQTIPRVREITSQLIEAFIQKTDWPLRLFFPNEARGSRIHRKLLESGKGFQFVFFNRTNVEGLAGFRNWAYRKQLGMPKPQNVLVACLMLGIGLRYSKIYLLGADHSWLENIRISEDNSLISIEKHFYDRDQQGKPTKKEHPEIMKRTFLHDYLHDLMRTFASYHLIRNYADRQNVSIINATQGSYIDAFERFK